MTGLARLAGRIRFGDSTPHLKRAVVAGRDRRDAFGAIRAVVDLVEAYDLRLVGE